MQRHLKFYLDYGDRSFLVDATIGLVGGVDEELVGGDLLAVDDGATVGPGLYGQIARDGVDDERLGAFGAQRIADLAEGPRIGVRGVHGEDLRLGKDVFENLDLIFLGKKCKLSKKSVFMRIFVVLLLGRKRGRCR